MLLLVSHINLYDVKSPVELATPTSRVDGASVSLPILFVKNNGWLPKDVLYTSTNGFLRVLSGGEIMVGDVRIKPGSKTPTVLPNEEIQSKFNYFGRGRAITNVEAVRSLRFRGIENGVDFVLNGLRGG